MWSVAYGVLLGLTSVAWASYYTYHSGAKVWVLSKTGEYVADLLYPGETDITHAYAAFAGQPGEPGRPGALQPPCDVCGDSPMITGAPSRRVYEWTGRDGRTCTDIKLPTPTELLNPVTAYRMTVYARNCASTRPAPLPPPSSLTLDRCTAVAGFGGVPDRKMFSNPLTYIATRLFGKSIQELRAMTPAQMRQLPYDKTCFTNAPPYPSWGTGTEHQNITTRARGSYRYDTYYTPLYDGDLGMAHPNQVFLPPMLYTVTHDALEATGWPGTFNEGDLFLPAQWLIGDQPFAGPMRDICNNSGGSRYLADWARTVQHFYACDVATLSDGRKVSVCEYSPSLSYVANQPGGDSKTVRGLVDWTNEEALQYIEMYMRFRTMRAVSGVAQNL